MVKMPRFETYCLEMGVKTLVTETGQQLPPSTVFLIKTIVIFKQEKPFLGTLGSG